MKVINVNKDACIGCGACVAIDDVHFTFDSDGKSDVISQENISSNELYNAIESCPTAAISLVDKENLEDNSKEACGCECVNCECEDCECCCDEDNNKESCNCPCDGCQGCYNEENTNQVND